MRWLYELELGQSTEISISVLDLHQYVISLSKLGSLYISLERDSR
jgi:hypothetical protein